VIPSLRLSLISIVLTPDASPCLSQYKVLKKGSGAYHPTVDSPCECDYKGTLIDGTQFDAGVATFAPNQVIKGWTEAMQLMVEGDQWEMYIPSDLAYGDAGSGPKIKGGETLIFQMEIKQIKGGKRNALTCRVNKEGCNDKEVAFIDKVSALDVDAIAKEEGRLSLMAAKPAKPDLVEWINRRLHILRQFRPE
jgi:FKBP-type peptidyl-prolyl cis-trans isomerase FklB